MNIPGRVQNGVVVLENGVSLPEGAEVIVSCDHVPKNGSAPKIDRVSFPLILSSRSKSVSLTNERIAEIMDEEDVSP